MLQAFIADAFVSLDDEAAHDAIEAKALAKLLNFQRDDFSHLFRTMGDRPVTVRLLDPPLHEFLSHHHLEEDPQLVDHYQQVRQPAAPDVDIPIDREAARWLGSRLDLVRAAARHHPDFHLAQTKIKIHPPPHGGLRRGREGLSENGLAISSG